LRKILYIGNFEFPYGNAAGKRVYGNGKLFRAIGYDTLFIGMNQTNINTSVNIQDTKCVFDNFQYYNIGYPKKNIEWLNYKDIFENVINFIEEENIKSDLDAIIYYGSPRLSLFIYLLIKWCKNNNIKIISDSVDWLSSNSNNIIFNIIKFLDTTYQKAYLNKRVDGVIAISTYLSKYYTDSGVNTIVIPPLAFESIINIDKFNLKNNELNICYAGLPFRKNNLITNPKILKDRIDRTIILFSKLINISFVFNIYGFTKEEYLKVLPNQKIYIDKLNKNIVFHGYVDNAQVIDNIKKADFTILLRDIKKDTMAGFPTKVSESLSYGTPVITTNTSDLGMYIDDGLNGFFLDIDDEDKALIKLKKILKLDKKIIFEMKNTCISRNSFYYINYLESMKIFLNINKKNKGSRY
jgi:glycosyltransferase involved in cell wall biosynthesis